MGNKIVLVGGGGHCMSVLNTIRRSGFYNEIIITDKEYPQSRDLLGIPIAGRDDKLAELKALGYRDAFITVGSIENTAPRQLLYSRAVNLGFHIPFICDSSAQISEYSRLDAGVFVGQNAVINAGAAIGKMAIINTGAIIEHECSIGEYSHVSVGAKLCGNVSVGSSTLIGAGATVIQGVQIGSGVLIGAGSVVLRDVRDGQTVVGVVK